MNRLSTIPITLDPSIYRPQAPMMERRRSRSITLAPSVFEPRKRSATDEYPSRRSKNLPPLPKSPWPVPPSQFEDNDRPWREKSDSKETVHIHHGASRTHSEPPSRQGSSHTQASQPESRADSNPPSRQGTMDAPPRLRRAVILERAPLRRPFVPPPKLESTPPPSSPPSRSSTLVGEEDALPSFNPQSRSIQTRYMAMLLSLDKIPRLHNILAALFGWILLAGFIVLPGTFTSIAKLQRDEPVQQVTGVSDVLNAVQSLPLSVAAAVCCGIGYLGNLWLSIWWRNNYVWLINRVYIPGTLNALAGLISALTSVYSQHQGSWSVSAKIAVGVESATCVFYLVLFLLYNNWLLEKVKEQYREELEVGFGGTFRGKVKRMAKQPAVAPGSIV
ncbi:hypothetical protein GE09DRAFT_1122344 [Coniochaeta sp. 2T2.1]|nr:hypothetical protein GE09DRAFT_1122344 [Coniochaeta sp. 2T2.1]